MRFGHFSVQHDFTTILSMRQRNSVELLFGNDALWGILTSQTSKFVKKNCTGKHKLYNVFQQELQMNENQTILEDCVLTGETENVLSVFPKDVIFGIMTQMNAKTLCRLSQVCKSLRNIASNDALWKLLLEKEFGPHQPTENGNLSSCKRLYHIKAIKKYVRLLVSPNSKRNDIETLVLEVYLGPGSHHMFSSGFPDWQKEEDEVESFLQKHPGYID